MTDDDNRVALKKRQREAPEIEIYPDAWDRFRSAVHTMTKAGPQHRIAAKPQAKSVGGKKKIQPRYSLRHSTEKVP